MLTAALMIGPVNLLRRRQNPTSTDLRRDIGIWAGVFGIAHTIAGLQVHMHGQLARYFTIGSRNAEAGTWIFVAANWLGLLAVALLGILMSISNDASLRRLGVVRWKLLQRSTYVVITAVILHGAAYQILEKRRWLLALLFSALAAAVAIFQWAGMRARRRRQLTSAGR